MVNDFSMDIHLMKMDALPRHFVSEICHWISIN